MSRFYLNDRYHSLLVANKYHGGFCLVKEFSCYAKGCPIYHLCWAIVEVALKCCPNAEHHQGKGLCPQKHFILIFDGHFQLPVETLYHSIGYRMVGGSVYVVCAQQSRQIVKQ